jgi:hypothetical protein
MRSTHLTVEIRTRKLAHDDSELLLRHGFTLDSFENVSETVQLESTTGSPGPYMVPR